ncbi:hypothetical protein JVU11DRAFT_2669 [Chiua virens]|nr:hypothetical protein JVU11DRAFT_2669 [Chiua virens]
MTKKNQTTSHDLVLLGARHVQAKNNRKRDENGLKLSTSRALVLRNGKYGARGTGELMLAGRISGREKLDLLAEDLVSQKSRTALMAPLNLDKCLKIADSQYNAYLDDIADLKDPDFFYAKIVTELLARIPHGTKDTQWSIRNPSHVASVVSIRVHNAYMVASGWKLAVDILRELRNAGLNNATARTQLKNDANLRSLYLVLCRIVEDLVDLGQAHFSVLAMTTPHYSRYFKEVNASPGEHSIGFDWAALKDALQLCFPRAPYPKQILYHILHDAVDESPKEAKRFPQAMWDAVGDLSVSLELQELLESPLLGPQSEGLKTLPTEMPEPYERWLDAQVYSKQASESYTNFQDIISPLDKTKDSSVLDNMWRFINLNYEAASGLSINSLWQLDGALSRTPQWSSFYMPDLCAYDSDSDGEQPLMPRLKSTGHRRSSGRKKPKKFLAIKDVEDDDNDSSMPELQSVSDSSGESDEDIFVSDTDKKVESEYDDESDYDSEEEELYRTITKATVPEFDALAEERKGNPFLKLLGSLRGRMFSSNPKLSSTTATAPRKGFFGKKADTRKSSAKQPAVTPTANKERVPASTAEASKDHRATVEDAEDEEGVPSTSGKKKKKPKKKKKLTSELPPVQEDTVPSISTPPKNLPPSAHAETLAKVLPNKPPPDASLNSIAHMSTSSLPIEPTVAQSAHSYLQELGSQKEKVKSRPNHASLFSDKRGFLLKGSSKDKTKKDDESDPTINKKFTWFTKLGKKTTEYMHQLMRTNADEKVGSLKWENFLKVMREMGFKYDPSTAGSSVRFDPPNPKDRVTHPDSTIHPWKLREYGAKLKKYYGWSEEDFLKRTSELD